MPPVGMTADRGLAGVASCEVDADVEAEFAVHAGEVGLDSLTRTYKSTVRT